MAKITIQFPKNIKEQIEHHPEIDWSLIFKKAAIKILHKMQLLNFLETKIDKSEFTEQDALDLSEKIKIERLKYLTN